MKKIISSAILLFVNLAVAQTPEIPSDSYPIYGYARCEKFLDRSSWSFYVAIERADWIHERTRYDQDQGKYVSEPSDFGSVFLTLSNREFKCKKFEKEYRWIPLRRSSTSLVQVVCKKGGMFSKFYDSMRPIAFGPVHQPRRADTPEYWDFYGVSHFEVPLEKCLSKEQKEKFLNGEEVSMEIYTRYRRAEGENYMFSKLEILRLSQGKVK
ncbi:MAG: hypothetical protein IT289_00270 [Oligoflexia bacterium]|nr:hypothetical protein [Oligoflexia bacterium]